MNEYLSNVQLRWKEWSRKCSQLIHSKKSANKANMRGAGFELAALASMRPDFFLRASPDCVFDEIAPKDFDVGIRDEHFAIEFFSPERNAVPLIVPTEGATEAQVQRQMFDGIRRGNAQSESLIMQANTKLHSKNADRYGGFLLLLMDTRGNDLLEDYFNDGEFAVGRIRDELAAPIRSATIGRNPPVLNLFVERPGFILAIAERTSWRLSHIHLMNGSAEQLRQIQRVFWLSKVTLD